MRHTLSRRILALTLCATLHGCAVWRPLGFDGKASTPSLPAEIAAYYDYPRVPIQAVQIREEKARSYVMRRYEFPLSLPDDLLPKNFEEFKKNTEALAATDQKTANDQKLQYTNRVDLYLPLNLKPGQKRKGILISPILGGNMVVDHFARYYAGRGYVAAIVHRKRPFLPDDFQDMQGIEDYMRTSLIRLRQAVDWFETVPEVDAGRIGSFGVSYGAVLHAMLSAIEPRVRYHILAMPAGPLADVIMGCPDPGIAKLVKKAREHGWADEKTYADLQRVLKTDPSQLAPWIPRDRVQVYVALFDRVVGAKRSFGLWKEMGKPSLKVMPFGHYGGILVFPLLQTQSYLTFQKHLR